MPEKREINLISTFSGYQGLGSIGEYLALGFNNVCDIDVYTYALNQDLLQKWFKENALSNQFYKIMNRPLLSKNAPTYIHARPEKDIFDLAPNDRTIIDTIYESDIIPDRWVPILNQAPVIVPTHFLVDSLKNSGVTSNIYVATPGVDPLMYKLRPRSERPYGFFTIGMVGPVTERKNTKIAIEAFKKVFGTEANKRLVIKGSYNMQNYEPDQDNIIFNDQPTRFRGIHYFYDSCDVLLAIGSEGLGVPLMEATVCGVPVITMNTEGHADMCKDIGGLLTTVPGASFEPYTQEWEDVIGSHWVPSVNDVANAIVDVYQNLAEKNEKARLASEWILKHRNIWNLAPQVLDIMVKEGLYE